MICGITGGGLRKRLWTVFEALLVQTFGVSGRSGFCGLIEELFWTPCTAVMYSFLASALNWVALERKRFRGLEKKITSQCDDAGGDVSWSSVFVGSVCVARDEKRVQIKSRDDLIHFLLHCNVWSVRFCPISITSYRQVALFLVPVLWHVLTNVSHRTKHSASLISCFTLTSSPSRCAVCLAGFSPRLWTATPACCSTAPSPGRRLRETQSKHNTSDPMLKDIHQYFL